MAEISFDLLQSEDVFPDWWDLALESGMSHEENEKKRIVESLKLLPKISWQLGKNYFAQDENGNILATASLRETQHDTPRSLSLWNVAVKSQERGRGLGLKFMQYLFGQASYEKRQYVLCYTSDNIGNFYFKCGMKKYGEIPNFLINPDRARVFFYKEV